MYFHVKLICVIIPVLFLFYFGINQANYNNFNQMKYPQKFCTCLACHFSEHIACYYNRKRCSVCKKLDDFQITTINFSYIQCSKDQRDREARNASRVMFRKRNRSGRGSKRP